MHPPGSPHPPPHSRSVDLPEPSITTTMRGLVRLAPLVLPLVAALIALYTESRVHGLAISQLQQQMGERASSADVARLEATVQTLVAKVDARDEATRNAVVAIQRDLERVCARVQCGR